MQLTPSAVAVRLRRLWAGEIVTSGELATSVPGVSWEGVGLELKGPLLILVGPPSHRDATRGPLGEMLARRAEEVTDGAITAIEWRKSSGYARVKRDRTSDIDVFGFHDPLLDAYPGILADVRTAIPTDITPAARAAVGALRMVGASQHRLWFAARTDAERDALRTVTGARAALVLTVQNYQGAKRPLHHVLVDPSYRAKGQVLVP